MLNKWGESASGAVQNWLKRFRVWLIVAAVISGGCFAAVELCNSSLTYFLTDACSMELTKRQMSKFRVLRLFIVVFLEVNVCTNPKIFAVNFLSLHRMSHSSLFRSGLCH